MFSSNKKIAVIIPCYLVKDHILHVIKTLPSFVQLVICVDDGCPEKTGIHIMDSCDDPRVKVIFHEKNQGVGSAVITGYKKALSEGAEILVKMDGDGQMPASHLPALLYPILNGHADYTKGNRFFSLDFLQPMPRIRKFGNAILSFMSKLSTGYWQMMDSTNGFTALNGSLIPYLAIDKISQRYFFETDLLFRLNILRAVVIDVPMHAQYHDEKSSLVISKQFGPFLKGHLKNFSKRIFYNYFLRDFSIGSLSLCVGLVLLLFGLFVGGHAWIQSIETGIVASSGTVMLSALPILMGIQFLMLFLHFDISQTPKDPIHKYLLTTQ